MKKMTISFNWKRYHPGIFGLLLLLFFICGCHDSAGVRKGTPAQRSSSVSRLAVIPFQVIVPAEPDAKMLSCPLCNSAFQADHDTQPTAGVIVQDMVLESLRGQTQLSIITPNDAAEAYRHAAGVQQRNLTEVLQQTAKELGVEAVLIGYVFRYRELRGKWYSAEKPASVAFELHLVRASDGAVIWSGNFDKTQESLMENLFQLPVVFKRGIKWITVKELSAEGVSQLMETFPGRQ